MATRMPVGATIAVVLALAVVSSVMSVSSLGDAGEHGPIQTAHGASTDWHRVDLDAFAIWLPPDWVYEERQGRAAFAGAFVGDGTELTFDLGALALIDSLPEPGAPGYDVSFEDIGGKAAKLVVAESAPANLTGVHFAEVSRDRYGCEDVVVRALSVLGRDLTAEQQSTALAIYRSIHFPGVGSWTSYQAPTYPGAHRAHALIDIDMVSPYEGWAVGGDWSPPDQAAAILHLRHGRWRALPSPADGMLRGIDMVSADEGWAVGDTSILHYSGGAWNRMDFAPQGRLYDVQMVGTNDGWITGSEMLLRYRDGEWRPMDMPGEWPLWELDMLDGDDGWATATVGNPLPPGEAPNLYRFRDDRWQSVPFPLPMPWGPAAIAMSPHPMGTGWLGGTNSEQGFDGGWLARRCEGRYEQVTATLPGVVYDIAVLDDAGTEGWAVGGTLQLGPALVAHLDDDKWTVLDGPVEGQLYAVDMVSRNEGWAVGSGDGGGVLLRYAGPDTPPPPPGTATATPPATATATLTATPIGRQNSIHLPAASKAPIALTGTGRAAAIAVAGDFAYLGDGAHVAVVDVSVPTSPWVTQRLGPLADECTVTDLVASDGHVYANCLSDRANAESPGKKTYVSVIAAATMARRATVVGTTDLEQMAYDLAASDGWVYVGGWTCTRASPGDSDCASGVVVIDARDPAQLSTRGFVETDNYSLDLSIDGGYLFVAGGEEPQDPRSHNDDAVVNILDLSTPGEPEMVARIDREHLGHGRGPAWGAVRHEGLLYVLPGPVVFDTSDPSRPEILTEIHFPDPGPNGLQPGGDYIHALTVLDYASYPNVFQVAAPLDPSTPPGAWVDASIVGEVTLPHMSINMLWENYVAASDGFAYVARGYKYGLYVIDVRDPAEPLVVGVLTAPDAPARD